LGLVGNSGEGKTTIALSLALLFDEFRGEISILNTNIKKLRRHKINRHFRHQIQLITQNASTSFDPEQTILENSIECLRGRGVPISAGLNTFKRLMRYFQISERCIKAYPHQLSSGEKQRLAIIRALSGDIRILIADEPFMHLDAANKERLVRLLLLLKRRRNNPLTVVMIMHDLYLARGLCDSILIIHEGKILEEDDPDVIFRSPKQEQTRKLVEASMFFGYTSASV
jgi:peptide/nickel transport system ATP-binding protein